MKKFVVISEPFCQKRIVEEKIIKRQKKIIEDY